MRDARFTIPTPGLLAKVVDLIAKLPMEDRDTKGDLYEYMLRKSRAAAKLWPPECEDQAHRELRPSAPRLP